MGKGVVKQSSHKKAGVKFPVSTVRKQLRARLRGKYLAKTAAVTNTVFLQEVMRAIIAACVEKMTDKERVKGVIRASHFADALADPKTSFFGLVPKQVAGIYRPTIRPQ